MTTFAKEVFSATLAGAGSGAALAGATGGMIAGPTGAAVGALLGYGVTAYNVARDEGCDCWIM